MTEVSVTVRMYKALLQKRRAGDVKFGTFDPTASAKTESAKKVSSISRGGRGNSNATPSRGRGQGRGRGGQQFVNNNENRIFTIRRGVI